MGNTPYYKPLIKHEFSVYNLLSIILFRILYYPIRLCITLYIHYTILNDIPNEIQNSTFIMTILLTRVTGYTTRWTCHLAPKSNCNFVRKSYHIVNSCQTQVSHLTLSSKKGDMSNNNTILLE